MNDSINGEVTFETFRKRVLDNKKEISRLTRVSGRISPSLALYPSYSFNFISKHFHHFGTTE